MAEPENRYKVGDHIVYCKCKASPHPGPRANHVRPSQHGEDYSYVVDKYWVVSAVLDDCIEAMTRTGKLHFLEPDDPNLRKATLIEKLFSRDRFPQLAKTRS
jgi:hypothetical protein